MAEIDDPEVFRLKTLVEVFGDMPDDERDRAIAYLSARYGRTVAGQTRGGLARAAALTPEQRSRIASTAAKARWSA